MISLILIVIEAFILSLFLSKYLSLQKEYGFSIIVFILCMIEAMIFYENTFMYSFIRPVLLFFTLLICIYLKKKCLTKTDALVCLLVPVMLIITNFISSLLTSLFLSRTVSQYDQYYLISSIVSKVLLIIVYAFINYYAGHENRESQWSVFMIVWMLVFILIFLFWLDRYSIYSGIFILAIISIILIIFIYHIQRNNEIMIKKEVEIQKAYYVQRNKRTVDRMYDDIQRIEHASLYNLSHIKLLLQQHNYDELNLYLDNNIDKMRKYRNIMNTDNPFFNYIMNQKINQLLLQNSNIKVSCILENKDIPISKEQIELLATIINQIFDISQHDQSFNITFYTQNSYFKVEIIFTKQHNIDFEISVDYKIKEIENYTVLTCLFDLDNS